MTLKILHTSDWHLGRALYGRTRDEEFEAFLTWLVETIAQEQVNVLLVAGDIFDTTTPNNPTQALYYRFLSRVTALPTCRHVVLIAGNHDSPAFLTAPKALLRALHVHVVGAVTDAQADEVIVLSQPEGDPELIVCAVPYLRDRDMRLVVAGESIQDKERKLTEGIQDHYARVVALAVQKRQELGGGLPIIAMGHLFTAGGKTLEGDGVRSLYVGSLAHVAAGNLPTAWDYLALGHLHVPQTVHGSERMRYSGSPLPMGFGEAKQEKSVCLLEIGPHNALTVRCLPVPVFQTLESIRGSWPEIAARIALLVSQGAQTWLEIIYTGEAVLGDLRERLDSAVAGSALEILRTPTRTLHQSLQQHYAEETLPDLEPDAVFERCLLAHTVPEEQRPLLRHAHQECRHALQSAEAGGA